LDGVISVIADHKSQLAADLRVGQPEDFVEFPVRKRLLVKLVTILVQNRHAKSATGNIVVLYIEPKVSTFSRDVPYHGILRLNAAGGQVVVGTADIAKGAGGDDQQQREKGFAEGSDYATEHSIDLRLHIDGF
jgi:hypothetical protein